MSTSDLDRAFAEFAASGDPARLGEVYDALAPELLRVAMHMTRSAAEAEDVLQATFVTAIERATVFEKGRPVRPWLTGILAQHARASWRSARRTPDPERTRTRDEMSPHAHAEQRELFETLDRVLWDLPEAFRPVLVLRLKHGLTAPEIAEALARPPGTVRSQLARGLEAVRRAMPAGLAGAFALLATQPVRGLASIRETILSAAAQHAPVAAAITPIAGAIALKKLALLAAALVIVWIGWRAVQSEPEVANSSVAPTTSAPVASAKYDETRRDAASTLLQPMLGDARTSIPSASMPSATSATRVEISATYARAGLPARGEVVLARFEGEHLPYFDFHTAVTDADGHVTFESVPPGTVFARMLHGGDTQGTAKDGETLMLHLAQAVGLFVEGEVVDPDGNAVRNASIWSCDLANPGLGEVTAHADAAGHFRLKDVGKDRYIAALSPDRALSELYVLRGAPGDVVHLQIVVDKAGAKLSGRVLDNRGRAVPRARVMAGDEVLHFDQPTPDGMRMPGGAPVHTVTDAEGHYTLEGVPLGRVVIQTRGSGFGTTREEVLVDARGTEHDITLSPEAIVTGIVRDARDVPLSGVEVRCGDSAWFAASTAWSDASGRFVLRGLRPGPNDLVAELRGVARVQALFHLKAGETHAWDPRLEAGADPGWDLLSGVLLDANRKPIQGWGVAAEREGAAEESVIHGWSDPSGRFVLRVEAGVRYRIVVHGPDEWSQVPRATRNGVVAGELNIEIVVGTDEPELATVRGTVVTPSGEPEADAQVIACRAEDGIWLLIPVDRNTGSFEIARLPPGTISLEVRSTTSPWMDLGRRTIEAGARVDLGTIRMPSGSRVTGRIVGGDDESVADVELSISDERFKDVGQVIRHGRTWNSNALAAGNYTLYARGTHIVDVKRQFEIAPGRDAEVEISVREAEARAVRVDGAPTGPDAWVTVVVLGPDAKQQCMRSVKPGADGVARTNVTVEPGVWKLLAISANNRRAETAFTHAAGDSGEIAVRLPD